MSGRPDGVNAWTRYRSPEAQSKRRKISSGAVFRPLIRAICSDRLRAMMRGYFYCDVASRIIARRRSPRYHGHLGGAVRILCFVLDAPNV